MTIGTSIRGLPCAVRSTSGMTRCGSALPAGRGRGSFGVLMGVRLELLEGARVGGADRRGGLGFGGRERRLLVLQVEERRVLGMGGQPLVDEPLDDARAAKRAPDEVV